MNTTTALLITFATPPLAFVLVLAYVFLSDETALTTRTNTGEERHQLRRIKWWSETLMAAFATTAFLELGIQHRLGPDAALYIGGGLTAAAAGLLSTLTLLELDHERATHSEETRQTPLAHHQTETLTR